MLWSRLPAEIVSGWRRSIEASIEAGPPPRLHLGVDSTTLKGLPSLDALLTLGATRVDLTAPLALVGGSSALWVAALFHVRTGASLRSPGITTVYTGTDAATQMAAISLAAAPQGRAKSVHEMIDWQFAPLREAGLVPAQESLPFVAADRDYTQTVGHENPWTAVAAVLLVVLLVLLALLL